MWAWETFHTLCCLFSSWEKKHTHTHTQVKKDSHRHTPPKVLTYHVEIRKLHLSTSIMAYQSLFEWYLYSTYMKYCENQTFLLMLCICMKEMRCLRETLFSNKASKVFSCFYLNVHFWAYNSVKSLDEVIRKTQPRIIFLCLKWD